MKLENIPAELCARDQWVCATGQKRPINPRTGTAAKVNEPESWGSFEEAKAAMCDKYPHIGYVLAEDDPFTLIDLDDKEKDPASDEQRGRFEKIINDFDSYTERSVSGRGYHVIIKGTADQSAKRDHLEVYSSRRFMICTGDVLDGRTEIHERQKLLDELLEGMRVPGASAGPAPRNLPDTSVSLETILELRSALNFIPSDDYQDFIRIGQALKELGPVGFWLWEEWAKRSLLWRPEDARRWDGFRGDNTGYEAVFAEAQRRGWINPRSNAARVKSATARSASTRGALVFDYIDYLETVPIQWLIDGWLATSTTAAIIGPSGTGKTFTALDMALSVATGRPWMGHPVKQGTVLYIPGEGTFGLRLRVAAWRTHHHVSAKIPLGISRNMPNLSEHVGAEDILYGHLMRGVEEAESVQGVLPALIIVDTVARALGGESDNEAKPMGTLIACMDRLREELGTTVLAVHHTGHQELGRGRGWSGLPAALDSWCLLHPPTKKTPFINLTSEKEKDWEKPDPHYFSLLNVPFKVGQKDSSSCVLHDPGALAVNPESGAESDSDEAAQKDRVFQLWHEGKTFTEIVKETNVPSSTAQRWCRDAGLRRKQ